MINPKLLVVLVERGCNSEYHLGKQRIPGPPLGRIGSYEGRLLQYRAFCRHVCDNRCQFGHCACLMYHRTVRQSPALPLPGVFIPFIQGPMTVRAITFFPMPPMREVWLRFSAGPILPSVLLSYPKQALAFSLYGMDSGVNAKILPDLRYIFANSRNRYVAICDQLGLNTGQLGTDNDSSHTHTGSILRAGILSLLIKSRETCSLAHSV